MTRYTEQLASFTTGTRFQDLPAAVVQQAKRMLLDSMGCAFGAIDTQSGRIAKKFVATQGGAGVASIVAGTARSSAPLAAYANARLGGVLDADDTFPSICHFGNTTSFSALALAEHYGRTGPELLAGIAVGFEVGARIGSAIGLPVLIEDGKVKGYPESGGPSSTMTWASVGASCNIARLGVGRTTHAFGIAGANSPLPSLHGWAAQTDLPMFKMADAGWCAQTGVTATLLADAGSTGYANVLDTSFGFWRFFGAKSLSYERLISELGSHWSILDTTYKPWPSCRWFHYPLTAFMALMRDHTLSAHEIDAVVVRSNPFAMSSRFLNQQPDTEISAQFSHAHSIAMMAMDIAPGPLWYTPENVSGPQVRAMRSKVTVAAQPMDADLSDWVKDGQYRRLPAGVDVRARGRMFSASVDMALGDPWSEQTRFTDPMLRQKFTDMVVGTRIQRTELEGQAKKIIAAVDRLEEIQDLRELTDLIRWTV